MIGGQQPRFDTESDVQIVLAGRTRRSGFGLRSETCSDGTAHGWVLFPCGRYVGTDSRGLGLPPGGTFGASSGGDASSLRTGVCPGLSDLIKARSLIRSSSSTCPLKVGMIGSQPCTTLASG